MTIYDFLWVLRAFLRGKLLRQKAYRPYRRARRVADFFHLVAIPGTTATRNAALMKWWGYRPATLAELYAESRARTGYNFGSLVLTPSSGELVEWEKHFSPDIGIRQR